MMATSMLSSWRLAELCFAVVTSAYLGHIAPEDYSSWALTIWWNFTPPSEKIFLETLPSPWS